MDVTHQKCMWATFLRKCVCVGILLIFATLPLVIFPWWIAPQITSKEFYFTGVVDTLICFWVWLIALDHRYRLSLVNIYFFLPLFILMSSLTLSSAIGADPTTSFWSMVDSGTGIVTLWHIFFFAVMVASLIRVHGDDFFKRILQAIFFSAVILAILTFPARTSVHSTLPWLSESVGGATLGHALLAAAYLMFAFFFTLILVLRESSWKMKIFYSIGIVIILISPVFLKDAVWQGKIPITQLLTSPILWIGSARFPTVSLVIGLCFSACLGMFLTSRKKYFRMLGALGLLAIILATTYGVQQTFHAGSQLNKIFVAESGNRLIFWKNALQGAKERPILGWGQENYRLVYQKYLDPIVSDARHCSEAWVFHPHNVPLEMLVNGGIVGFILYLNFIVMLLLGLIWLYRKNIFDAVTFTCLLSMVLVYFLQIQMMYDSSTNLVMLFSTLGIMAGFSERTSSVKRNSAGRLSYVLAAFITLIMMVVGVFAAYLPARKVAEANTLINADLYDRIKGYPHFFHSMGSYVWVTDAAPYVEALIKDYSSQAKINPTDDAIMAKDVQAMIDALDPVWQKRPMDYHLVLSLLMAENFVIYLTGDISPARITQATRYFEQALPLSPTDPQIYYRRAETLFDMNDFAGAEKIVKIALALSPDYVPAQKLYTKPAMAAYRDKKNEQGRLMSNVKINNQ